MILRAFESQLKPGEAKGRHFQVTCSNVTKWTSDVKKWGQQQEQVVPLQEQVGVSKLGFDMFAFPATGKGCSTHGGVARKARQNTGGLIHYHSILRDVDLL